MRIARRRNRWWGTRSMGTIALAVVAGVLVVVAGWMILDRTALDDSGPTVGIVPDEMPADFPIPPGAEIGESTVDEAGIRITLDLVLPGSLVDAVSQHTVGLVSAGYLVSESAADGDGWIIRVSKQDMRATIDLRPAEGGIASRIMVVDP